MSIQSIDTRLLLFVNNDLANPLFDILMPALTKRGFLLVIPFLLAMFLRGAKQKSREGKTYLGAAIWATLIACCATYLALHVEDWMKDAVARARPCRALEGVRLILACPKSFSMPSGHAMDSFAFVLPLFYLSREYIGFVWRLYPIVLAAFIAFSRIYLGVHYPTDVLAGAFLGSVIGLGLAALYRAVTTEEFLKRLRR